MERCIIRDWKNILSAVRTQASTDTEKRVRAEYTNNAPPPEGGSGEGGAAPKSYADVVYEKEVKRYGG